MTYLQISLKIANGKRVEVAGIYNKYRSAFLDTTPGAKSKELLMGTEDVQILHGFVSIAHAEEYLKSRLLNNDFLTALKPLLDAPPQISIYETP